MSDKAFARVGDALIESLEVKIPNIGPWTAEVEFIEAPALSGQITINVGAETLIGTIIPTEDGTFGLKRRSLVVAGAGAWGTVLQPKHYHNDAGVKAQLIAADAAREAGETLGNFVPTAERLTVDYVRAEGPASLALLTAAGGAPWWVDYAGATHVGPRPSAAVDAAAYEVLAFNPHTRRGTLAVDTLGAVGIGSIVSERLDTPQAIRELTITVNGHDGLRARFWSGAATGAAYAELAQLLTDIIDAQLGKRLYGKFEYRVVGMASDGRVDVQAVRRAAGLPDQQTIRMFPGIPGMHAELTPGASVVLEFLEGDPTRPIITGYVGKTGSGFVPLLMTIGGATGPRAARVGDEVTIDVPKGTVNGSPIVWAPAHVPGTDPVFSGRITKGSDLVEIAGASV